MGIAIVLSTEALFLFSATTPSFYLSIYLIIYSTIQKWALQLSSAQRHCLCSVPWSPSITVSQFIFPALGSLEWEYLCGGGRSHKEGNDVVGDDSGDDEDVESTLLMMVAGMRMKMTMISNWAGAAGGITTLMFLILLMTSSDYQKTNRRVVFFLVSRNCTVVKAWAGHCLPWSWSWCQVMLMVILMVIVMIMMTMTMMNMMMVRRILNNDDDE